jgi:hypothetical protein
MTAHEPPHVLPIEFGRSTIIPFNEVGLKDVAAIAHIPYEPRFHESPSELPTDSPYHRHRFELAGRLIEWLGRHAFCRLFATGNLKDDVDRLVPPRSGAIDDEWIRLIEPATARAAFAFRGLRLRLFADGVVDLKGEMHYVVGSTPVGVGAMFPRFPIRRPRRNMMGTIRPGGDWPEDAWRRVEEPGLMSCVEYGIRFRIGDKADRVGRFLTGHWAPWAFIVIGFRFDRKAPHKVSVQMRSSWIPSVNVWCPAEETKVWTMSDITRDELHKFVTADLNAPAPGIPPTREPVTLYEIAIEVPE